MFFNKLKKTDFLKCKLRDEHNIELTKIKAKIKILKEWFYSSLDKAEDLISEILKIGCKKIFRMGNK